MSLIYYIIIFLLAFGSIQEVSRDQQLDKSYYQLTLAVMMLTAGLGYNLSPDWLAYYNAFYASGELLYLSEVHMFAKMIGVESGYIYMNRLFYKLGFDFGIVSLVLVIISLSLKFSTLKRYSAYPMLALFMYTVPNFFFEEHIHIRQGIATAICLYSVRYVLDRKFWKFMLCLVIAYQFHQSSMVFFLAYWLVRVRISTPLIGVFVGMTIVANYTGLTSVIDAIMEVMPIGQEKFEAYESDLYKSGGVAVGDIVKIITVVLIMIYNKAVEHDKNYVAFRNLFLMGVMLYFFLGKGIFGIRLPGYYLVFLGLVVCSILYNIKDRVFEKNLVFNTFFCYTIALFFWFQLKQAHKTNFNNYSTIFSSESIYGLWR
ncbi:EpsG family protein [Weeksella virosa]|uniref:EpsG family protein n=1 Tax=Weeksella virosa (strain ATCC 43766 / DSM 16922 / JCM 21250 / CCUG 30538 / CDC 9751 / IAM 14551 / NBRC 16016 / NCTC 11634 / CL345/78) TaxID=865938 RepID=F0NZQ8_WEEVC|nr:EpsG family protein [Weeksella virosa]ADX67317.1 hypothetical protein Weevi_0598 [Weeksella virosa DSM 16922]VEH62947.1 Uncharacterised protein [Weeksella virosa]